MKFAFVPFFVLTCLSAASGQSVVPASSSDQYLGEWNWANPRNGDSAAQNLDRAGKFSERGQPAGSWQIVGSQLVFTYKDQPWVYTYDLPPENGVLHGHTKLGEVITLSRPGSGEPGYFGTSRPATGAAPVRPARGDGPDLPTVPSPAPAPPVPGLGTGRGVPVVRSTPKPLVPAAVTPAPGRPDSAPLTPVGKWHWHAGPDRTFVENGAVLQEGRVTGQWKWTDKAKGELQVLWSAARRGPPEIYTLSPQGDHLTDSPAPGQTFTDDRIGASVP